jgi:N-acetylmuramoyl-L-alanine amidase
MRFGISPFAIWQNKGSHALGSDTRGFESYKSIYADSRRWVKEGWVDYICPQIYWYIGFEVADYEKVLSWWIDVCKDTNVDLYIGHAVYQEVGDAKGWSKGEIIRQLEMNQKSPVVKGSIFFRESNLRGDMSHQIREYYIKNPITSTAAVQPVAWQTHNITSQAGQKRIMDRLTVAQPSRDVTVNGDHKGYNVLGTAVPGVPLYLNGQLVTNRTAEGFFSVFAPIQKGDNRLTFVQEGQPDVVRVITLRDTPITHPPTLTTLGVSEAYPAAAELGSPGHRVTLRCTAPAGSTVTATLNGVTISLSQDNANIKNHGSTVYAASFSGAYTLPAAAVGVITDIGKPVYTATFNGQRYTATAPASVRIIGADTPYHAQVTAAATWTYPQAGTTGGSSWALVRGQKDRVTAVTGNGKWARLSSGVWVEAEDVRMAMEAATAPNVLTSGRLITGEHEDYLAWSATENVALNVSLSENKLTVAFGMQRIAPPHAISQTGTLVENVTISNDNGIPTYVITLRPNARLEGYYTEYKDGELRLILKKRKPLTPGEKPLAGFRFVIDAGHGDTDSGALGPMGRDMPEKAINLINAQKLAANLRLLGAEVIMVRDSDVFLSLQERTNISRNALPDMFISYHANSLAETTDATNVRGLTMWYRNPLSKPAADLFIRSLHNVNPLTTRRVEPNQANFFVCRPSWTPSVILEASFMNNIDDFAWMVDPSKQDELSWGVANAILAYYK